MARAMGAVHSWCTWTKWHRPSLHLVYVSVEQSVVGQPVGHVEQQLVHQTVAQEVEYQGPGWGNSQGR